jgi:DNA excision repair protein ERCC-6
VHEVLAMLEADDDLSQRAIQTNIYITPPSDATCSDEDSGDEDSGGSYNNLTGKQLQAESVATVRTIGSHIRIGDDDNTSESDDDSSPPVKRKSNPKGRPIPVVRRWIKEDLPQQVRHQPDTFDNRFADLDLSPASLFELFFDEDVIALIEAQTKMYAMQKGKHTFELGEGDIKLFLAILFTSGYAPLPSRRHYWEPADDIRNIAISKAMTRNRFEEIMQLLHLANNENLTTGDKVAKVRPLLAMINERFLRFFPQQAALSIDESMVPYYGRHGMKQFIRGKPVRFGYKVWSLNTPLGYCVQFEPYQGSGVTDSTLGLGGSVVLDLISELPPAKYQLFFDNFFTNIRLLNTLSEMNIGATGTVRVNRTEKCPLVPPEKLKKQPRGTCDFRHDKNTGVVVVRWHDNSVVTVASNCYGVEPYGQAQRWSYAEKKRVAIQQPNLIAKYNCSMGGVDRMDQNIAVYRISIRSKKWWWPFFSYCADVAMQNAWLLYRLTTASKTVPMDQLQFRRSVTAFYFGRYGSNRLAVGRPVGRAKSLDHRAPPELRFDGQSHLIGQGGTQRRCAVCGKKATHVCTKCNIGLHIWCFGAFHCRNA